MCGVKSSIKLAERVSERKKREKKCVRHAFNEFRYANDFFYVDRDLHLIDGLRIERFPFFEFALCV